jgi:hypothetical protein
MSLSTIAAALQKEMNDSITVVATTTLVVVDIPVRVGNNNVDSPSVYCPTLLNNPFFRKSLDNLKDFFRQWL